MIQQHDEFQAAFQKECNYYMSQLQKPVRNCEKKDPERLDLLRGLCGDLSERIIGRLTAYENHYQLDKAARAPEPPRDVFRMVAGATVRSRLQELQAKLEQSTDEEAQLRQQWLEMQNAASDEALSQSNVDVLRVRTGAFASEEVLEGDASVMKAQQMQQMMQQIEAILSATAKLTAEVEQERENNNSMEEQRRRVTYMEAELMVPVGDRSGDAPMDEDCQNLTAEAARNDMLVRRMQRQNDECA